MKSKSLDNLDYKVFEADFFLNKMIECEKGTEMSGISYYLSAFLTSTRSITFVLQNTCSELPGFKEWYSFKRSILVSNPLAKVFLYARNEAEKEGIFHITSGSYSNGKSIFLMNLPLNDKGTERDDYPVIKKSNEYFKSLINLILDLYIDYGVYIDPEQYYTIEGIEFHKKSIEDVEESLFGVRGWTKVHGVSDKDRLQIILTNEPQSRIGELFKKYLNKDKPTSIFQPSLLKLKTILEKLD